MNNTPITYVTSRRDDPEPLTLTHLLHGRRLTGLPYSEAKAVGDSSFPTVHAVISHNAHRLMRVLSNSTVTDGLTNI
ncbi:hypothetical protein DPMN_017449 [Dreissena polymorpha]|uniref:Uncharacterized protein n=1 Tax=Dreissena polymorpha TaxID=45954 RepID=A0A9D4NEV3_DREPO|nr:hypothetical protein DPMN_017449 [Dreissena polymorpha]